MLGAILNTGPLSVVLSLSMQSYIRTEVVWIIAGLAASHAAAQGAMACLEVAVPDVEDYIRKEVLHIGCKQVRYTR